MPRARPAIRASRSRRWLTHKSRYRNTRAKVKTTVRARAVARILVKTRAKEREAAQPTEASRSSSNQTLAGHIGGCLGRFREGGTASVAFPVGWWWSAPVKNSRTGAEPVPPERESLLILRIPLFGEGKLYLPAMDRKSCLSPF